jgi:hypothetical protein
MQRIVAAGGARSQRGSLGEIRLPGHLAGGERHDADRVRVVPRRVTYSGARRPDEFFDLGEKRQRTVRFR